MASMTLRYTAQRSGTPSLCLPKVGQGCLLQQPFRGPGNLWPSPLCLLSTRLLASTPGMVIWQCRQPLPVWPPGDTVPMGRAPRDALLLSWIRSDCFFTATLLKATVSSVSFRFVLEAVADLSSIPFLCPCPNFEHPSSRKSHCNIYLLNRHPALNL